MGCVRLPKGTAAGGQRRRRASSELSCVRKRHEDGELLDIRGGLDGVGEHEQPRIDHADAAGGAGGDLEVVGDVLPGRPAAPQLLAEPASCSARASLRACKWPFRPFFGLNRPRQPKTPDCFQTKSTTAVMNREVL